MSATKIVTTPRVLRDYQVAAVQAVHNAHREGTLRPAVVLPTGTGKSSTLAKVALDHHHATGRRVVLLAHRGELLDQLADNVAAVAGDSSLTGRIQAEANEVTAPIITATVQTLSQPHRLSQVDDVGLVIVDECFPAGTTVDGRPIETLRAGDLVTAVAEDGTVVVRPVTATFSSVPTSLVQVTLDDGGSIVCTPGHPFLTEDGWVNAGALLPGVGLHHATTDMHLLREPRDEETPVVAEKEVPGDRPGLLHPGVLLQPAVQGTTDGADNDHLHGVRGRGRPDGASRGHKATGDGQGLLFQGVRPPLQRGGVVRHDVPDESSVRIREDEEEQPHEGPRGTGEDEEHSPGSRSQTTRARGERSRHHGPAEGSEFGPWGVADGGSHSRGGRGTPAPLHRRPETPHAPSNRGGGRAEPQFPGEASPGPEEGRSFVHHRVHDVTVLEPGSDGEYGGLCPGGVVYNIEVDQDHTYTVNGGVVVHNCHHAVADSYLAVLGGLGCFTGTPAVGFTATLSRGDDRMLGQVWDEVVFSRSTAWAIDEGFLVPPVGKSVVIDDMNLDGVSRSGGDFTDSSLGEVIGANTESIVTAWLTHGQDRQTLAFTPSVDSAFSLADDFRAAGVPVDVVVGTTPPQERQEIYERYRAGDLRVIVSVAVLTEGFDAPATSCVLMARPTSLAHIYVQAVGRGLRPAEGKDDCLVLDVVGVSRRFPLTTIADLGTDARTSYVRAESEDELDEDELTEGGVLPPPRLRHVTELADVDLFRLSESVWLHTNGGVRFIPAGDEYVFLWPTGDETYLPGRTRAKRPYTAATPMTDGPVDLDTAAALAEAYALKADPTLASRTASWRTRRQPPSAAQVKFAERLGIPNPAMFTRAALSDAITTLTASAVIDR